MLNKNTIQVLQSITPITNSAIISYPITTIQNASRDVLGNINLEALGEEAFDEFGIFDLSSFLGAVGILDEPVITMENKVISAKDTDSSIKFVTSSVAAIEDFTTDPRKITSTVSAPSVVSVNIETDMIAKIRKGVNLFKTLKDVFIIKNDDGVFLKTGNKESFARNDNSYQVQLTPSVNEGENFELAIPVENFLSLPAIDYTLNVKHNPNAGEYRITAENAIYQFVLSLKV